jgi:hypothetical protein
MHLPCPTLPLAVVLTAMILPHWLALYILRHIRTYPAVTPAKWLYDERIETTQAGESAYLDSERWVEI